MVKKVRICIDYIDMNKTCPKDNFLLLKIDQLVDATSGYKLSFMDVFLMYNQIRITLEVEENIAFVTKNRYLLL